jgi:hypothetical protein
MSFTFRHKLKYKNRVYIAALHFKIAAGSSTTSVTHNFK